MKSTASIQQYMEEHDLRFCEKDFWDNPIIGKEVVRFNWYNPKYKGHFKTFQGLKHFDQFIMDEMKAIAEERSGGFHP